MRKLGFLLILCAFGSAAHARETARVLPKGIFRARVVGVSTTGVRDTFNDSGKLQGVGHSLNRNVTIYDLARGADPVTRQNLETLVGTLNRLQTGLGDELARSELFSDVTVRQQIYLGALEYGLTPRLSLGARIPVVRRRIENRFQAQGVNNALAARTSLGNLPPAEVIGGLGALGQKALDTAFFEESLFTSKGYDLPRNFEKTQLGDIEVGGKYELHKSEYFYTSTLVGVSAPTGAPKNIRNPFDTGNSREAWSYAAHLLQEWYPFTRITIGANARLGYSLRDTRDRAVPRGEDDSLPNVLTQVERVKRQRGAQLDSEVSAYYRFPGENVGLWGAYQYAQKGRDRFYGNGGLYYQGLARNTNYRIHAAELGAEVSTIPNYRRGTFPVPMEVSLLVNRPLRGVNSPMAPYARLDLMVYF